MSADKRRCFVIMPFSKTTTKHTKAYWTRHYESFLKPLVEETPELEAHRSEVLRQDIVGEIIKDLAVSSIVVADLTDNNPNVYWELGVRQSFKYGTVTIAEEETNLASDITLKGTICYPKDHLSTDFRDCFKKTIKDCLENPDRPDSDVLVALGGRGSLYEIFRREEILRRLDAVLFDTRRNIGHCRTLRRTADERMKTGKGELSILPFIVCSLELLAVDRYVDEDDVFFEQASDCLVMLLPLNEEIAQWRLHAKATDEYLLGNLEYVQGELKKLQRMVEVARTKVMNRF